MENLLNFNGPFDVSLLDNVVNEIYSGDNHRVCALVVILPLVFMLTLDSSSSNCTYSI